LTSTASSIVFSDIPANYTHLQLRILARATDATAANYANLKVNNDVTGTNYARHLLYGNGASAAAAASTGSGTVTNLGEIPAASATAGMFGVFVVDFLDYASTSKNKTIRSIGGDDRNGGGELNFNSILWMNNSTAISSIQLTTYASANFAANSHFALYGIKAG
jgi:hypothetical protein